jgi:hypothetical protein
MTVATIQPRQEDNMNRHTGRHKKSVVVAAVADTMNNRIPSPARMIFSAFAPVLFSFLLLRGLL